MIKTYFHKSPTTLAIGDGLNDILMMHESDISIELCENFKELTANSGDIIVNNLSKIKDLLLVYGRKSQTNVDKSIFFVFYQSVYIVIPIFMYSWFSSFTGVPLIDTVMLFLLGTLFIMVPLLTHAIFDKPYNEIIVRKFEALYRDGLAIKNITHRRFQFFSLLEATIHGIITLNLAIYSLQDAMSKTGQIVDLAMLKMVVIISILLTTNLKVRFS